MEVETNGDRRTEFYHEVYFYYTKKLWGRLVSRFYCEVYFIIRKLWGTQVNRFYREIGGVGIPNALFSVQEIKSPEWKKHQKTPDWFMNRTTKIAPPPPKKKNHIAWVWPWSIRESTSILIVVEVALSVLLHSVFDCQSLVDKWPNLGDVMSVTVAVTSRYLVI